MTQHYGQIVERTIRRSGFSISELARLTKVNRRSVYNWFNQKNLRADIIYRIGRVIKHDFSIEFPELFSDDEFRGLQQQENLTDTGTDGKTSHYWKEKYIELLEKYNGLLLESIEQNTSGTLRNDQ